MGKRKRKSEAKEQDVNGISKKRATDFVPVGEDSTTTTDAIIVQIVTGSYERALHGIMATIFSPATSEDSFAIPNVSFADTFLFNAHSSAIRCLAISPPSTSKNPSQPAKVILASGGTDERINLYHISASPPAPNKHLVKPTLTANTVNENPRNRELGSLLHHSSSISSLYFPSRSKLLSAAEDNTIAVVRTRDWTVLSTIKAPIPKALGRPSGDTAPPGGTPAGVNDFAVHPSMKLMVSVGKGEKCMRLWNLVTGKKAGVLNFGRDILQGVGEGRWGSGEGRKVEWDSTGEEFAVAFERGVVIFGMDSKPKRRIVPQPLTKVHQMRYIKSSLAGEDSTDILALSTEDGRVIVYPTADDSEPRLGDQDPEGLVSECHPLGQLSGRAVGLSGRVKDFELLNLPSKESSHSKVLVVAGSSDGLIRLWTITTEDLNKKPRCTNTSTNENTEQASEEESGKLRKTKENAAPALEIGKLIGTYETGNRITCLKAFVMSEADVDNEAGKDRESSDEDGSN